MLQLSAELMRSAKSGDNPLWIHFFHIAPSSVIHGKCKNIGVISFKASDSCLNRFLGDYIQ